MGWLTNFPSYRYGVAFLHFIFQRCSMLACCCICLYIVACIHICLYMCIYMYTHMSIYVYIHVYTMSMYVYIHVYTYVYICVYTCDVHLFLTTKLVHGGCGKLQVSFAKEPYKRDDVGKSLLSVTCLTHIGWLRSVGSIKL